MATDRMNTVESQLNTDLNAESDITDEFKLLVRGFPSLADPGELKIYDHHLPAIYFEIYACNDLLPSETSMEPIYERQIGLIFIFYSEALYVETKKKIKELISLVRDFLHSDDWTYKEYTELDQSGYDIDAGMQGFLGIATIPFTVDIKTS